MTVLSLEAPRFSDPFRHAPVFGAAGLLMALSLAVTLPAMGLDPRLFQGESVWLKPVKFQIALSIYLLTLAVYARWMPTGLAGRLGWRLFAGTVVFCIAGEIAWIAGAAMFATASHFNVASPLLARLYALMGVFAVTLTSASLVMGVAIWRNRNSGLPDAVRLSLGLGLVLTFVLTVVVAGTLSQNGGHFVGTPVTGAEVPVLGWSREVGDLRAAHLLATHALHALPLAGLAAAWLLPPAPARAAVWLSALAYAGLVAFAFFQALDGQPFLG